MTNRISEYWPEFYLQIKDFRELGNTEANEFDNLDTAMQKVFDDAFVLTSDEQAVALREKELNIQADPSTESLEFRKQRILNRYQTHPPFSLRWLQRQLDRLVGEGLTLVEVDYANRILTVVANVEDAPVFKEVQRTVETTKPANMIYQQQTGVEDYIVLVERIAKREITWNYGLGTTWQLGEKPFATLGPEVIVK